MNIDALLDRAVALATSAHAGQVDKGGSSYILHPLRVMNAVSTPKEKLVAVLHDVIEDTDVTADELASWLPEDVMSALHCLTKKPSESYEAFIARVVNNPLATCVKIADIQDNLDVSRLPSVGPADEERMSKYQEALRVLKSSKV